VNFALKDTISFINDATDDNCAGNNRRNHSKSDDLILNIDFVCWRFNLFRNVDLVRDIKNRGT
jgi:hypothetical protein